MRARFLCGGVHARRLRGMSGAALSLSVLDLVPVPSGVSAADALRESLRLAQHAEDEGYKRYWVSEHHNMASLASSVPLAVLSAASQVTRRIRLGSGGVMLPNHAPLAVAEGYRLLSALAPDRADLGLGRAPGTDGRTALALRGSRMEEPFERQLAELLSFGTGHFPDGHPFAGIVAAPVGADLFPPLWILSSSGYGSRVAAEIGAGLSFAWHINPSTPDAAQAARVYREHFRPSAQFPQPAVMVAASVICAPTQAEADDQALALGLTFLRLRRGESAPFPTLEEARAYPYTAQERQIVESTRSRAIVGGPEEVAARLKELAAQTGADELMINTLMPDPVARRRSYSLVMEAMRG